MILGVWDEYMVVLKHDYSAPFTMASTCWSTGTYRYELSMYWCILVCTMITDIFLRMLFCVQWLSETILCMRDMQAVIFQHWISASIHVQNAWLCFGIYSVHTSMYLENSYIWVHSGMYQYVPVQTRFIQKTLFLYHWSRFQMCSGYHQYLMNLN